MIFQHFPILLVVAFASISLADSPIVDTIIFGDDQSEFAHSVSAENSDVIKNGGLGEPARRLLPSDDKDWQGGKVSFVLKVDPDKPNYVTARFWGDDKSQSQLILYCEGKQIGYRHLGDIDVLDTPNGKSALPGRFFYTTTPLPIELTRGKTKLTYEIRSTGHIWGYGTSFDQYQKPMTEPTRGIYRLYTHPDGYFDPPADEKQGVVPSEMKIRTSPGVEVLDVLKYRVNSTIDGILAEKEPINQHKLWFISRAYHVKWTTAYHNPKAVEKIVDGIDALYLAFKADPKTAVGEKSMYNFEWFGLGPAGQAATLLKDHLQPLLDKPVNGATEITRRQGWADMFAASRDYHRVHRRFYTNQTMISDLYGVYLSNRGVEAVDSAKAIPEKEALRYLYESTAIEPWRDSDSNTDVIPETGTKSWNVGENYWQLTAKGLTKELGFVGYYGEVLDWMTAIYDATRSSPDQPGDQMLKGQLIKAAKARLMFRYPEVDDEGNRAMRAETIIGWRDQDHYPADIIYAQRTSWDGHALESPAATLDPVLIGAAQQMLADNQYFKSVQAQMEVKSLRATAGLLKIPDDYETVRSQPRSTHTLPMTRGMGHVAFTDEEDGVVAIHYGDELLYVSLYWRARYAINDLARVHHITPQFDRIAVVRQQTQFDPSGMIYTRPNWTNFGFGNGGIKYPGDLQSAHSGEKQPIARIPAGIKFKPGDESVYAGRGEFYTLRYGPYLIGMNCSPDKTFELTTPAGVQTASDLVSGEILELDKPLRVGPRSTVVLLIGR